MTTISFIGLGRMGQPMAKNLLQAGFTIKIYDVISEAMEALQKEGAFVSRSIAEAVKDADVIFTMLQTGEQVSKACLDASGIFATIQPQALYIDCSSIDVETSRMLHRQAIEKNIAMLDAPVSGGVKGATMATLTFMVGGEEENFERAQSYLQHLGKKIIYAGSGGCGQVAKICNNMVLAISMVGVSEAFVLAEKLGLDPKKFFEISSNASGQCWSLTSYCPMPNIIDNVPSNNDYKPGFAAKMMLKDLNLSQKAAASTHTYTPLGAAATELYQHFVDQENTDIDFSGIINMIKEHSTQ